MPVSYTHLTSLVDGTVQVISGTVGGITNAVIAFILALYILLGKEKLKGQCASVCRAFLPKRVSDTLLYVARLSSDTFASFVTGQCMEACILGTLCWLGMTLFRFSYAPMIGALVGICALIPIVGAVIGTVVGAFMILMVDPVQMCIRDSLHAGQAGLFDAREQVDAARRGAEGEGRDGPDALCPVHHAFFKFGHDLLCVRVPFFQRVQRRPLGIAGGGINHAVVDALDRPADVRRGHNVAHAQARHHKVLAEAVHGLSLIHILPRP